MRPLLPSGFGTSLRVNGLTLEVDWRPGGSNESHRPWRFPFDSMVVDFMPGSVNCED